MTVVRQFIPRSLCRLDLKLTLNSRTTIFSLVRIEIILSRSPNILATVLGERFFSYRSRSTNRELVVAVLSLGKTTRRRVDAFITILVISLFNIGGRLIRCESLLLSPSVTQTIIRSSNILVKITGLALVLGAVVSRGDSVDTRGALV